MRNLFGNLIGVSLDYYEKAIVNIRHGGKTSLNESLFHAEGVLLPKAYNFPESLFRPMQEALVDDHNWGIDWGVRKHPKIVKTKTQKNGVLVQRMPPRPMFTGPKIELRRHVLPSSAFVQSLCNRKAYHNEKVRKKRLERKAKPPTSTSSAEAEYIKIAHSDKEQQPRRKPPYPYPNKDISLSQSENEKLTKVYMYTLPPSKKGADENADFQVEENADFEIVQNLHEEGLDDKTGTEEYRMQDVLYSGDRDMTTLPR